MRLSPHAITIASPSSFLDGCSLVARSGSLCGIAALVIGFSACLRPAELAGLRVDDVLLPSDRMACDGGFYVKVRDPKMRRLSARRKHVFVEQPTFVVLLEVILKARPRCSLLFVLAVPLG
eukprot:822390-Amphidinium_carterae.1